MEMLPAMLADGVEEMGILRPVAIAVGELVLQVLLQIVRFRFADVQFPSRVVDNHIYKHETPQ